MYLSQVTIRVNWEQTNDYRNPDYPSRKYYRPSTITALVNTTDHVEALRTVVNLHTGPNDKVYQSSVKTIPVLEVSQDAY
jgi:hypothetical protein